jgi:ABC-type multidrug transport system ATPase subunit
VAELPYGRRRLLAIARAVAARPSVLLLDEPCAGLDETESAEVAGLLRSLADDWGLGILLNEHDMDVVMGVCDRVMVLDAGERIAEGPPAQVRNDPRVRVAYLGEAEDPRRSAAATAGPADPRTTFAASASGSASGSASMPVSGSGPASGSSGSGSGSGSGPAVAATGSRTGRPTVERT